MTDVKIAEGFSQLENFCKGFKSSYNPGRATLKIEALTAKKLEGTNAINNVIGAKTDYDDSINQRKQLFATLPKAAASIMRVLEASGVSAEKLADARGYVKQMRGRSGSKKMMMAESAATGVTGVTGATTAPAAPAGKPRSKQQLAYVSKADWLAKLISTIASEPLYAPNEENLQMSSVSAYHQSLTDSIKRVSEKQVALNNARIEKDHILYHDENSLCNVGRAVKKYVRGIYGPQSEHYTQLSKIRFVKKGK